MHGVVLSHPSPAPGEGGDPRSGEGEGPRAWYGLHVPITPHPSHRFAAGPFPLPGREREPRQFLTIVSPILSPVFTYSKIATSSGAMAWCLVAEKE
ncbi:hypothetical protein DS837_15715 [Azospirillum brasilense]|uniref:Uncharacterized protein n=1 Tax=Azospirillum brasilense TaxID=192 RepID=A0A6L3AZP0_AZOBR|nr:hypothetical protein DS837_15715 [Azospirillum brasilense]